jgi:hypothetical protein
MCLNQLYCSIYPFVAVVQKYAGPQGSRRDDHITATDSGLFLTDNRLSAVPRHVNCARRFEGINSSHRLVWLPRPCQLCLYLFTAMESRLLRATFGFVHQTRGVRLASHFLCPASEPPLGKVAAPRRRCRHGRPFPIPGESGQARSLRLAGSGSHDSDGDLVCDVIV